MSNVRRQIHKGFRDMMKGRCKESSCNTRFLRANMTLEQGDGGHNGDFQQVGPCL